MGFHHSLLRFSGIVSFSFLIAACSSQPVQEPDLPERVYYEKAQKALADNLPATAISHLRDLDSRYPFGEFSSRAELDLIFAHMQASNFVAAHTSAERFIRNHPENEAADYAYYMRALSTYKGAESLLTRFLNADPSDRDAKELAKAFREFADFTSRYPNSAYAPDAKARMLYLRDMVARHELQVARYYLKRQAPLSALRRSQQVIQDYPSSRSVEDALAVSIQSYMDLNKNLLAETNLAVLKQNFPNSSHLDRAGNFVPLRLPSDADPGFLYWVSLGIIN